MSNGSVELANFVTLLRILKLMVSGRHGGKSSLANCHLCKDTIVFPSSYVHDWAKQQNINSVFPAAKREDCFSEANKTYNLSWREHTANIGNKGNVQQIAH